MAFNPNIINTNIPPPNYPTVPIRFPSHQVNPFPTPPVPPQSTFSSGMHVLSTNSSPFNAVPPNHVPSPSPPVRFGLVHNPMQTSSPIWNNNTMNLPIVNNQNFSNVPPVPLAQNTLISGSFQPPMTSGWCNSVNPPQNNHNSLLAIASNSCTGNNPQNLSNYNQDLSGFHASVRSNFQSSSSLPDGTHCRNNATGWSESNSNSKLYGPPPTHFMPVKENQNHFNMSRDSNAFSRGKNWNPIQKTDVPDSNIFENPSAIFNMTEPNSEVNSQVNGAEKHNFQEYNVTNRFIMNQGSINLPQKFNSALSNNFVSLSGASEPNYSNSVQNQNRYFQQSNNSNLNQVQQFSQTNVPGINNHYNFNFTKPDCNGQHNLSFQHNNQNLIDVRNVSNKNAFEGKPPNRFYISKNSSNINKKFPVSSTDSIDHKTSPLKNQGNTRSFGNLQKIETDSSNSIQKEVVWMTEEIQKALQKRNMLFKQAKATKDPAVWDEYNKLRDEINEDIKQAKLNGKNNKRPRNTSRVWQDRGKKFPFNCDSCDKGFYSNDELEAHMSLHVKCHYSGCNFKAHPGIVSLHQKMQHDTGYADAINKLQNDEEIKKWREERRRRFPTAENILKKKAEQAEKEARGEVIQEKEYGKFKKRHFDNGNKEQFGKRRERNNRKRVYRNEFHKPPEIDLAEDPDSEDENECPTKLPKFQGMKKELEDVLQLLSTDSDGVKTDGEKSKEADSEAPKQSSLGELIPSSAQQDVKESDDDDAPLEIPIQKVTLNESLDSGDENDNETPVREEKKEFRNETSLEGKNNTDEKSSDNKKLLSSNNDNKGIKREKKEKRCRPPVNPRPKNSLLKMLLSNEIRHERNVIMQCVRHIVKNNFFREADT